MPYPVDPVDPPDALNGQSNGKLPLSVLTALASFSPVITLENTAARAWKALAAAAASAGHPLQATSAADSYRTYNQQVALFEDRYTLQVLPGQPTKVWQGHTYYLKRGEATAAVPGTSNHGLGLAVDVANASGARLDWLVAHEQTYGFSHELQSEPWHIRYTRGDNIPAAVLAYEEAQMAITADEITAIALKVWNWDLQNGPGEDPAYVVLNRAMVDAHTAATRPAVEPAPVDPDALNTAVAAAVAAAFVAPPPDFLAAVAKAVLDEQHNRLEA